MTISWLGTATSLTYVVSVSFPDNQLMLQDVTAPTSSAHNPPVHVKVSFLHFIFALTKTNQT